MHLCPATRASIRSTRLPAIAAVLAFAGVHTAYAETPNALPEWYYSQGHLLEEHMREGEAPKWTRVVGLSAEETTKYEGGNAYQTSGGPSFDVRYRDLAFASTGEGLGVNLLHDKNYRAGLALTYDLGRNNHDDHHLGGTGNLSIAPEVRGFAEYLLFPVTFRVDVRTLFGGQGGWVGDISLYSPLAGSKQYFVFAGPSLTFANATNQRHYYGIDETQSLNSGYPVHPVGSGLRSASFGISAGYFLTDHWLVTGMLAAEQLLGGAGHSPLVQEQGQMVATFTVAYRW